MQNNINNTKINNNTTVAATVATELYQDKNIQNNISYIQNNTNISNIDLEIIYEDEDLLVVNKPINLIVHMAANPNSNTVVKILLSKLQNINTNSIRPGIVHRLDKDTSGLLLVAKNDETLMELSKQMKLREIKRTYHAIIFSMPDKLNGTIITNIARDPNNRLKMKVSPNNTGKKAITHYKVLKFFPKYNMSLIECELETGRTHQIRVHMSYIGNSIVGDQTYGKNIIKIANSLKTYQNNISLNKHNYIDMNINNKLHTNINNYKLNENFLDSNINYEFNIKNFNRQALHAVKLEFIHPIKKIKMQFESKLPKDIQDLIKFIS
ncbi:MAG: RluA family pseudouridine synthase [Rickettsiales bacterium]